MLKIKIQIPEQTTCLVSLKSRKPQKRKRKPGPKVRKSKRVVKFNETAVGHFLYVYAPVQYCLLMEYCKAIKQVESGQRIKYNIIEAIAINSDNAAFKTARFRRALIAYRRFGTRPLRKTGWSLRDAVYYARNSYHIYEVVKKGIHYDAFPSVCCMTIP